MAWWGPSLGPWTHSPVLSAPYLVAQAGFMGMPPVCWHRVPTWFNDRLLLSWNFLAFLKKGTHILIFHWTPQIICVLPVLFGCVQGLVMLENCVLMLSFQDQRQELMGKEDHPGLYPWFWLLVGASVMVTAYPLACSTSEPVLPLAAPGAGR